MDLELAERRLLEQNDRTFEAWSRLREHLADREEHRGMALCGLLGEEIGELCRALQQWRAAWRASHVAATRRRAQN